MGLISGSASADSGVKDTIRELVRQNFFRSATCSQIADHVLQRAGLPGLDGAGGTKNGVRLSFDRKDAKKELPTLRDGIATNAGTLRETKLDAAEVNGKKWKLMLERKLDEDGEIHMRSVLEFSVIMDRGAKVCQANSFRYALAKSRKELKEAPVSPKDCVALFSVNVDPARASKGYLEHVSLFREDCALFLRNSNVAVLLALP